ncbi:unnamed protein product [Urochloa humidicola]
MASSLLLAALALAAFLHALAPVPAAMAGPASAAAVEGCYRALEEEKSEVIMETLHHLMHKFLEEIPSLVGGDANGGGSGGTAPPDAIRSIITGGQTFSLATVDITAQLTATTRCTGLPVPCSSLACLKMAPRQPPLCASLPNRPPACAYGTSALLFQGQITLLPSGSRSAGVPYRSLSGQVYTCRVQAAGASSSTSSGIAAAVLGLGWRGADSLGLRGFSYSVSSKGEISLSLSAASAWGGNTVKLLPNPNYPDLYYVRVTGINVAVGKNLQPVAVPFPVGGLDLRQDGSGGGVFLSTTMPLTLLDEGVYDSLIQTLRAQLPLASISRSTLSNSRQLCYRSGTQIPEITLVLDGGAMKLPADNCWYTQDSDDGSVCLAILPSLSPTGESMLGTMMQSGWRLNYNLAAKTLVFQRSSSPPSSTVLHNSSGVLLLLLFLTMFLSTVTMHH